MTIDVMTWGITKKLRLTLSLLVSVFIVVPAFSVRLVGSEKNNFNPPRWAADVVWYQIFPERFANGDPANDPTVDDLTGSWPHERPREWNISLWTGDWFEMQPWEKSGGKDFYYNTQLRRYGGDLQGILSKLDYLKELGISAIYLNPVFESPSLHKYDASMYHHIDNNFGPDPALDRRIWSAENPADPNTWQWTSADSLFLNLIRECHTRGIKIIIDGVFNHVGLTFWAFQDVQRRGAASPYVDWFTINRFDDTTTSTNEFDYVGWFGVKELPELKEDSTGFPQPVKRHIHSVVKRWMDPNGDGNPDDGIDGWRLDVASMVNIGFWKEFREWTRTINPESYLVGEVWWEDWSANKMYDPAPWVADGSVFDAVMNYRGLMPIVDFCSKGKNRISASEFMQRFVQLQHQFPADVTAVQMNTIDSHDTDRLSSIVVNPDRQFDHAASTKDNPGYDNRKPNKQERALQKMILALQFVSSGAPSIYYGNEAGMWGGDDPDDRKPMVWRELDYAVERSHPFEKQRPADTVAFDADLFRYHQSLIRMRSEYRSARIGRLQPLMVNENDDIVVFAKTSPEDSIVVCANRSGKERKISFKSIWQTKETIINVLSKERCSVNRNNIVVTIPSQHVLVLGVSK
ncbi:MAG: glycoside hydrolase family 13 protein [Bacteroidota bacterium]